MKTLTYVIAIWLVFFIAGESSVQSQQTQTVEGYTFMRGLSGPQVCLGRWVPSTDVTYPGVCEGQVVDVAQLTAISSRLSADRLDQILLSLASIDQKLALNNDQIKQLIDAAVSTKTSIDQQSRQSSEILREAITRRFDNLPAEILANDQFKEEMTKLKEDILKEIEKRYPGQPKTPTK